MKVEIVIDQKYQNPKIVVYANDMSKEVANLLDIITNSTINSINGYIENKLCILKLEDIYSIYSENGKVYAKTNDNIYNLKHRIYELEESLRNKGFIRISNSEIVNFKLVKNLDFDFINTIRLNFINDDYSYVSSRYIKKIKDYLKKGEFIWE